MTGLSARPDNLCSKVVPKRKITFQDRTCAGRQNQQSAITRGAAGFIAELRVLRLVPLTDWQCYLTTTQFPKLRFCK